MTAQKPEQGRAAMAYGAILVLLPALVTAINPLWLSNSIGDRDVWMYYGYLDHLFQYSDHYIWPQNAYIGTRIPYILPGYLAHRLLGDVLYKYVFNLAIICPAIILSYFTVLRKHLPLRSAAATTALIGLNFYLLRSIGWDYVDKALAVYEALTFALLSVGCGGGGGGSPRRVNLATVAAGFTAASMIFVHLASGLLLPVFFLYSAWVVRGAASPGDWARQLGHLALFGGLGALAAQAVWGGLLVLLQGGEFFFLFRQLRIVGGTMGGGWNSPLPFLLREGTWITPHLAAFVGATVALLAVRLRREAEPLPRFETLWLWVIVLGYGILFAGEVTHRLFLFSREGMYATVFIPISMIGFGILLFRAPTRGLFAVTVAATAGSVLLRLGIGHGAGLSAFARVPVPVLGAVGGALLAVAFIGRRPRVTLAVLVLLGLAGGFDGWHFTKDRAIREAHARILKDSGGRLPTFYFRDPDPFRIVVVEPKAATMWSIVCSFTDRALVQSRLITPAADGSLAAKPLWGQTVPDADFQPGDTLVVLSADKDSADAQPSSPLLQVGRNLALTESFAAGNVWATVFTIR